MSISQVHRRAGEARRLLRGSCGKLYGRRRAASPRARGRIRTDHPVSIHGVCTCRLAARSPSTPLISSASERSSPATNPPWVSEHLAWSTHESTYFNDLLPLPYTKGDSGARRRPYRPGPGHHRPIDPSRKSFNLHGLQRIHDVRDGLSSRACPAQRVRIAARRQQRLRIRNEPRLLRRRLFGRVPDEPCRRDPFWPAMPSRQTTKAILC